MDSHPPPSADKGTPPWTVFTKLARQKFEDFAFLQPTILGYFGNIPLSNNCCLQPSWATTFIDSWGCFGGASQRERWKVASIILKERRSFKPGATGRHGKVPESFSLADLMPPIHWILHNSSNLIN